ncbi:Pol [Symbiodinium sp. CCMP2456]|nr:Pol [Symbiodinium sp. CCMP2456]
MSMAALRDFYHAAVDGSTIVSYWKRDPNDNLCDKFTLLLDMVAGADCDDSDEEADDDMGAVGSPSPGYTRLAQDDDENPIISDKILSSVSHETNKVLEDLGNKAPMTNGRRRCPLCPFRSFTQLRLLRTHVQKHHTSKNQYVCSGTKQIKVILALYDHAASSQTRAADLLQTSAAVMRATIEPALCERINCIDKQIRQVLDADGPHYVNVSAIGATLQVMGQAPCRASKKVRDEAPFGDAVAWRRLLTVRGRTGAVLMMHPLQNESSEQIVEAMQQNFTEEQLQSVRYVGTDSPSEKLFTQLQYICPNLEALMLDPIHLAIVYEYAFWNKKSSGSKQLRRILRKCIAVDSSLDKNYWQLPYDGKMARPLGDAENKFRDMILDLSMSEREAVQLLDQLDQDTPFLNRVEFIKSVAALCRIYKSEVTRAAAGPNKAINKIV